MKLIQTNNKFNQAVPSQALVNIGKTDRKINSYNNCINKYLFVENTDSITINCLGYYKVDANFVVKSAEACEVNIGLVINNVVISKIKETYVGGDIKTLHLDKIIRLEKGCFKFPAEPLKIQLVNLSEGEIEIQSLNLTVLKVE